MNKTPYERVVDWLSEKAAKRFNFLSRREAELADLAAKELARLKSQADDASWRAGESQRLLKDLGEDYDRLKGEHERLQRGLAGFRELHKVMCTLFSAMSQNPEAWQEGVLSE
jgi:hypothetical protein